MQWTGWLADLETRGPMNIRVSDINSRQSLIAYLREHRYLAFETGDGVAAEPLNPVSDRFDRSTLHQHLAAFGLSPEARAPAGKRTRPWRRVARTRKA
jgi:hypothetical protein